MNLKFKIDVSLKLDKKLKLSEKVETRNTIYKVKGLKKGC